MGVTINRFRRKQLGWSPNSKKYVCAACVKDDALAQVVRAHVARRRCDFCRAISDHSIAAPVNAVTQHMAMCFESQFGNPTWEYPHVQLAMPIPRFPHDIPGIRLPAMDSHQLLYRTMTAEVSCGLFNELAMAFRRQQWCYKVAFLTQEQRLGRSWELFKNMVKHERRYTFWSSSDADTPSVDRDWNPHTLPGGKTLHAIGESIRVCGLIRKLPAGTRLWRARTHRDVELIASGKDLSSPPTSAAVNANRMSPSGIPMFYGAEDLETARAEAIDPKDMSKTQVTAGMFRLMKHIQILDLVDLPPCPSIFDLERTTWRHACEFLRGFSWDVAEPIVRDGREHIEYVPTQAFTEFVRYQLRTYKDEAIQGIRYQSARSRGRRLAVDVVLFFKQEHCIESDNLFRSPCVQMLKFDDKSIRRELIDHAFYQREAEREYEIPF